MTDAQKTPLTATFARLAQKQALDAIAQLGVGLPASVTKVSGSIVMVKFELQSVYTLPNVTVPLAGAEWIRYPIQVGTKGMVIPSSASLGAMSGLGVGTADLSLQANLSALVFLPIGNSGWTAPLDPNKLELYGKTGVIIHSPNGQTLVDIVDGMITITVPDGNTVQINGNAKVSGTLEVGQLVTSDQGLTIDGVLTVKGNAAFEQFVTVSQSLEANFLGSKTNVVANEGSVGQVDLLEHTHTYIPGTLPPIPTGPPNPGT